MSILRKYFDISGILKNKKILCIPFDRFVLCILVLKLDYFNANVEMMANALITRPLLILFLGRLIKVSLVIGALEIFCKK